MGKYNYLFEKKPREYSIRENMIRITLEKGFAGYILAMEEDKKKADKYIDILLEKNLLDRMIKEANKRVVGEQETIKALHICASGRLVKDANIASYNLNINSDSGAGKDHVSKNTLRIYPKHIYLKRTRITKQAFTYWHANEKDWTWDGKILYLEDVSESVLNSDTLKVMLSSGSDTTVVKDQKAIDLKVNGKPIIIVTTAESKGNRENRRRMPTLELDETTDQTEAILIRSAEAAKNGARIKDDEDLRFALSLLRPVEVVIPFADKLPVFFPKNNVMIRTHFPRFLDYIKAHAALYQLQRERDEHGRIIATSEDYDAARDVLIKTTSNPLMVTLSHKEKKFLERFATHRGLLSVAEINQFNTEWQDRQLRTTLDNMARDGFLLKGSKPNEAGREILSYEYVELGPASIPKWENLDLIANTATCANTTNTTNTATCLKGEGATCGICSICNVHKGVENEDFVKIVPEIIDMSEFVRSDTIESSVLSSDGVLSVLNAAGGSLRFEELAKLFPDPELDSFVAELKANGDVFEEPKGVLRVLQ